MENYLRNVIDFAIKEASLPSQKGEIPVCAVIFDPKSQEIISYATNKTEEEHDPTAHAEIIAIRQATKKLQETRLTEYDMFVTLEPCPMCAAAISFARLRRVYFGAYNPKAGGIEHGCRMYETATNIYRPEVYGGFEETRCSALVTDFFKSLRKDNL